ncbi:MAG: HK97 family phage prohead protease [Planctomycetota bacterium]
MTHPAPPNPTPALIERRRMLTPRRPEVRAAGADTPGLITGYAAVFYDAARADTEYELWAGFVERIMPGAFDRALAEGQDVRALFNHDANHVLGRTAARTLRLTVDAVGLRYEIDAPDTQFARDLSTQIERGDVDGSSFSFSPRRTEWIETDTLEVREIHDVDLRDVGPVTFPAYTATSAGVRAVSDGADLDLIRRERAERHARTRGRSLRRPGL